MDLTSQLRASLLAQSFPPPSTTFLTSLLTTRSPPPPLPSLLATAKARLLASDLTSSTFVDRALLAALPASATSTPGGSGGSSTSAPAAKDVKIPRDVHVQVLDVENLSISRWEQVEELEAVARGERTRGRQVVRVTAEDDDDNNNNNNNNSSNGAVDSSSAASQATTMQAQTTQARAGAGEGAAPVAAAGPSATHRLVLQDHQGNRIYAVELRRVDRIGVGKTCIGEKMVLRAGAVVSRGSVLLTPETCTVLGGKVEAWHDTWLQGRLARLKEAVGGDRPS